MFTGVSEADFFGVAMESQIGVNWVRPGLTKITAEKGHNFRFDRWIVQKYLQEFSEANFLVVAMEFLLGDE